MRLKFRSPLLILIPLLLLLVSCGEDKSAEGSWSTKAGSLDSLPRLPELDPTNAFPDYNPEDREAFEEAVYLQHLHLMGQVSKRAIDSIMKIHLLGAKNLKEGKKNANRELNRWMARQDTLARRALATQFAISRDSVDAILKGRVRQPSE